MFIEDEDFVELKIRYIKNSKIDYDAYTNSEFEAIKDGIDGDIQGKMKEVNLKMKPLTWGIYNDLQEGATIEDDITGERKFLYKKYKESRLRSLIVEWDTKDKDGNVYPIDENSITHMVPAVAEAILRGYDEESYLSKDEEKN